MAKIALTGKLRSGKDTLAEMFIEQGYKPYKLSLGITEIIEKYFSSDCVKGVKLRNHYTTIGQSLRTIDDLVWVNRTWQEIQKSMKKNVVITDIRQKNEEVFLRSKGFIIIKVEADEDVRIERSKLVDKDFDISQIYHETELSVDEIEADYTLYNNEDIGSLKAQYDMLCSIINLD